MSTTMRRTPIGAADIEAVLEAVESGEPIGFCTTCGCEHYGVEPDARRYECESCGERTVFGSEDLLISAV